MMNSDPFSRSIARQPAKSETQRPAFFFRFAQMLMRTLQRREREPFRSNHLRLAHRVPLARAVTVQRDEQRRGWRCRNYVIVQFDFSGERALYRVVIISRHFSDSALVWRAPTARR